MSEMLKNDWLLSIALLACWYWGFVSGKWWEDKKHNPPPPENDEMWW